MKELCAHVRECPNTETSKQKWTNSTHQRGKRGNKPSQELDGQYNELADDAKASAKGLRGLIDYVTTLSENSLNCNQQKQGHLFSPTGTNFLNDLAVFT